MPGLQAAQRIAEDVAPKVLGLRMGLQRLQSNGGRHVTVVEPLTGVSSVGAAGGGGGVVKLKTVDQSLVPL